MEEAPVNARFVLILLAIAALWPAAAQTIVVGADAQTARAVPHGFFGYNDANEETVNRMDPNLLAAIAKVPATVNRFPAGEYTNYWDWAKGLYVANYDTGGYTNNKSSYPKTLDTYHTQWQLTHSTPIFMLNMLTDPQCVPPSGGLCQYTPATPNLNYQLQMLQAAQAKGFPIQYVELGNEFYIDNKTGYTQVYPDPVNPGDPPASTVYARLANQWTAAVKKQFPQALVAALAATTNSTVTARKTAWNPGLFPTLQGEDAITLHTYITSSLAKGTVLNDAAAEVLLAMPFSNWASVEQDIAKIPQNLPIWMTEYGLKDEADPVWGTWAHGLVEATMTLLFLEEPRVQMAVKTTLIGNATHGDIFTDTTGYSEVVEFVQPPNPPPTVQWGRSAADMALVEIGTAAASTTQTVRLNFTGAPTLSNGKGTSYSALYGWSFQSGTTHRAVVINYSSQPLTINVGTLGLTGAAYDQITGAPFTYVTGGLSASPTNLTETSGTLTGNSCALPAYSITRIWAGTAPTHQPSTGGNRRRP
jgi:hypothetical protein